MFIRQTFGGIGLCGYYLIMNFFELQNDKIYQLCEFMKSDTQEKVIMV